MTANWGLEITACDCERSEAISKSSALRRDCHGTPCLAINYAYCNRHHGGWK